MGVVLILVPSVIKEYLTLMSANPTSPWLNTTIGSFLRLEFGYDLVWLIYLPLPLGVIWLVWFWIKNHATWNWEKVLPILLIVSAVTTPFGWLLDITLVIPAILYAINSSISRWNQIKQGQRIGIMSIFFLYLAVIAFMTYENGKLINQAHQLWWFSTFLLICFVGLDKFSRVKDQPPFENPLISG